MRKRLVYLTSFLSMAMLWANSCYAEVDSYRYLHVSVETPYTVFLFLLVGILAPFILMGILVWRFVGRKNKVDEFASVVSLQQQERGHK